MNLIGFSIIFFALALFVVSAYEAAVLRDKNRIFNPKSPSTPLFWNLLARCFSSESSALFYFYISITKNILLISLSLLLGIAFFSSETVLYREIFLFISLLFVLCLISDFLPSTWATVSITTIERSCSKAANLCLFLFFPIASLIVSFRNSLFAHVPLAKTYAFPKKSFIDTLELQEDRWSDTDKRLVSAVLHFQGRIAREIMKPRVELFCIPENATLHQAAILMQKEGYSRVPVYKDTIDTITGILFYKDVLVEYAQAMLDGKKTDDLVNAPIQPLCKTVFYCPETKKISSLLQEFRKRKTHLAVIVDEYGGTSGLVTIEDILEEIVGEISDEYDEHECMYEKLSTEGWIVDARMNLLDIEEELGIIIPQEEDYDTLAGYIFYRVGSIPQAGLILHHDTFEIEITQSNDRMVEKVRITPTHTNNSASLSQME